jgi:predicted dehydrogenase
LEGEAQRGYGMVGCVNPHDNAIIGNARFFGGIATDHHNRTLCVHGELDGGGSYDQSAESAETTAADHQHDGVCRCPQQCRCAAGVHEVGLDRDRWFHRAGGVGGFDEKSLGGVP